MKKITILVLFLSLLIVPITIFGSAPFVTYSPNRFNVLIPTQDAYETVRDIRVYDNKTFNAPQDIFIDDDFLYVADTGNKLIVVLDKEGQYLMSFGDDRLVQPMGLYVRDDNIYIADYGQPEDSTSGRIHIYSFDRVNVSVNHEKSYERPNSPVLVVNNFLYRPQKIAVDNNHTMYVISEGSYNGVMMINEENRFLNFFATNRIRGTLLDYILQIIYGNRERSNLDKKIPPAPNNIYLKETGYIYTTTQTLINGNRGDTLKKVNNGGINFFPSSMITSGEFADLFIGNVENIYAVTKSGFIYEYDREGHLLFVFGGSSQVDRLGLFKNVSGITVDNENNLFILDDANNNIHILRPTAYAEVIHQALYLYNQGKYLESQEYWEEVLRYNALFDLAHEGIGRSYLMQAKYKEAMDKFMIANKPSMYSQAMWEVRNLAIQKYSSFFIIGFVVLYVFVLVFKRYKKYIIRDSFSNVLYKVKEKRTIKELIFMTKYIKKPLDSFYEGKAKNRVRYSSLLLYLAGLVILYLMHLLLTGFLFRTTHLEHLDLSEELFKIIGPFAAFVFANYLSSSLMEGEGTFKSIVTNTSGALIPVYIFLPILILISNGLTLNEGFIYYFGMGVMVLWSFLLLFFMIKDTHNFSVKETIYNILLTLFMMLVMIIVLVMLYMMIVQVIEFILDLIKEVIISA